MDTFSYKRLVILANSVKRNHWCVAGKELFPQAQGWTPGLWVRPTDPTYEGAISEVTMRCQNGRMPAVLDIVDVPCLKHLGDANHPEDWLVDATRPWRHHGIFPCAQVDTLCDQPSHLWSARLNPHKVREGYVSKMLRPATLYWIKPEGSMQISLFKEASRAGPAKLRRVLRLRYRDTEHEFAITDPRLEDNYLGSRRVYSEKPVELELTQNGDLFLCLSLTPSFHGAHYKIAATIWERPPL